MTIRRAGGGRLRLRRRRGTTGVRTRMRRTSALLALAVVAGACSAGGGVASSTSSTAAPSSSTITATSTTTTSTTLPDPTTSSSSTTSPADPPLIGEDDRGPLVAALQFYLDCSGFGPLVVDGVFGPDTAEAVAFAQLDLGAEATGEPTEPTFAALSRACDEPRPTGLRPGAASTELAGNVAPGDDEVFGVRAFRSQQISVSLLEGSGIEIAVEDTSGSVLRRSNGDASVVAAIDETADYRIRVSGSEATTYLIDIELPAPDLSPADVVLRSDGLQLVDIGEPADEVSALLGFALGAPTADQEWGQDGACLGGSHWRLRFAVPAPEGGAETVLIVHFTDYQREERVFTDYRYVRAEGQDLPPQARGLLSTLGGITIGSTTAALESVHPGIAYDHRALDGVVVGRTGELPDYWIEPAAEIGPGGDLTGLAGWVTAVVMPEHGCPEG